MSLAFVLAALAQDYRFPGGDGHYGYFYPTAYKDDGGADWNCGSIYYSGHNGSDYGFGSWDGMDAGRQIVAAAEGTVVATNDGEYDRCSSGECGGGGGFGNYVKIQHANGRTTYYAHLKAWTVAVAPGQWVGCGTHLGYGGSSGNSTGPHVHFEVRESSGYQSDPFDGPCSAPPTYWLSQGAYGGLPGGTCANSGPCTAVATVSCGQTLSSANNAGGATQSHSVYGCGEYPTSGPEIAYTFSTPVDEPVTIGLTGVGADLDLFVLGSAACDGSGALTCSTNSDANEEWLSFNATANTPYTLVVDGYDGAVSGFNLVVSCVGAPSDPDPDPDPDPEPIDTGTTEDGPPEGYYTGEADGAAPGAAVPLGQVGCGDPPPPPPAAGARPGTLTPLGSVGALLLVGGLLLRRRRAAR